MMMQRIYWSFSLVLLLSSGLCSAVAQARQSGVALSTSAGISSTSAMEAAELNPAGLVETRMIQGEIYTSTDDKKFQPSALGGQVHLGNGYIAAMLGAQTVVNTPVGQRGSKTLGFGGAIRAPTLFTNIGVSGSTDFDSGVRVSSVQKSNENITVGIQTEWTPFVKTGLVAYDVKSSPDDYGAGIAVDFLRELTFAVDGTLNKDFKGARVKPGFTYNLGPSVFTLSYGTRIDKIESSRMKTGFTGGLGLELNNNATLFMTYNQVSKYFAGLVLTL